MGRAQEVCWGWGTLFMAELHSSLLLRSMGTLKSKSICDLQERAICESATGDKFWSFALSSVSDSLSLFTKGERYYVLTSQGRWEDNMHWWLNDMMVKSVLLRGNEQFWSQHKDWVVWHPQIIRIKINTQFSCSLNTSVISCSLPHLPGVRLQWKEIAYNFVIAVCKNMYVIYRAKLWSLSQTILVVVSFWVLDFIT